MAIAAPSINRETRSIVSTASLPFSLMRWWHLLSLDAPTVAAVWSWFFLRVEHVDAPLFSPLLLALGTWLIYVADRILDGLAPRDGSFLRERHYFYIRHRAAFTGIAMAVAALLGWLVLTRMSAATRREDTLLFLLALLYFLLIHIPKKRVERWLPKELAVGVLFAAATAVPAWSRMDSGRARLLPAIALFAALCWLNCIAIERWENPAEMHSTPQHATTLWAAARLRRLASSLAVVAAMVMIFAGHPLRAIAPLLACVLAACLLVALDCFRERVSTMYLRIAADAALLTPLLFLPIFR